MFTVHFRSYSKLIITFTVHSLKKSNVYSPRHFRSSYKVVFGHLYLVKLTVLDRTCPLDKWRYWRFNAKKDLFNYIIYNAVKTLSSAIHCNDISYPCSEKALVWLSSDFQLTFNMWLLMIWFTQKCWF